MKQYVLVPLLSAALAALSAWAVVQCRAGGHGAVKQDSATDVTWLRKEFGLSAEQEKAVAEIAAKYRAEVSRCAGEHCGVRCRLNASLFASEMSDGQLRAAVEPMARIEIETELATVRFFRAVHAALTPEQRLKFEKVVCRCVCATHEDGAQCRAACGGSLLTTETQRAQR